MTIVPFVLEFSFSGSSIGKAFYYAIYILINFVNIVLIGMMSKNKSTIYSSMYNGLYVLYGLAIGSLSLFIIYYHIIKSESNLLYIMLIIFGMIQGVTIYISRKFIDKKIAKIFKSGYGAVPMGVIVGIILLFTNLQQENNLIIDNILVTAIFIVVVSISVWATYMLNNQWTIIKTYKDKIDMKLCCNDYEMELLKQENKIE